MREPDGARRDVRAPPLAAAPLVALHTRKGRFRVGPGAVPFRQDEAAAGWETSATSIAQSREVTAGTDACFVLSRQPR